MSEKQTSHRSILQWTIRAVVFCVLVVLFWSCGSVPGLKEETIETFIKVPFVRVLLEDQVESIVLTADASFAIECLKYGEQSIFYSSQPVRVENGYDDLRVVNINGDRIAEDLSEVNLIPRGINNRIKVGDRRYRGIMKIVPRGVKIHMINIIHMEDYLKGVVPPELGKRSDAEFASIEAQAVAARTYAMSHLKQYQGEPYDVKSSIIDQVYMGANVERKGVNEAIEQTSGQVLTYDDELINAYYHSTCGGMTDDIGDVWDRQELPYLKPVVDSACSWSKYFNWTQTFSEEQLRRRLERYLSEEVGNQILLAPIKDIIIRERSAGGRIKRIQVVTENDTYNFRKDRIRWAIRRSSDSEKILHSANFEVSITHDQSGRAKTIVFEGSGYGHGVGMCQCGAIGLARQGWNYEDILLHFYTGVNIKKLY